MGSAACRDRLAGGRRRCHLLWHTTPRCLCRARRARTTAGWWLWQIPSLSKILSSFPSILLSQKSQAHRREEEQAACLRPSSPKINSGAAHATDTCLRLPRGFVAVPRPTASSGAGNVAFGRWEAAGTGPPGRRWICAAREAERSLSWAGGAIAKQRLARLAAIAGDGAVLAHFWEASSVLETHFWPRQPCWLGRDWDIRRRSASLGGRSRQKHLILPHFHAGLSAIG